MKEMLLVVSNKNVAAVSSPVPALIKAVSMAINDVYPGDKHWVFGLLA